MTINISLTRESVDKHAWCVYLHFINDDQTPIFAGVCKVKNLLDMKEARGNTAWLELVRPPTPMRVAIIHSSNDYYDVVNYRMRFIMAQKTVCNMKGKSIGVSRIIICNETKQEFKSITEAARAFNADLSNMNNHVNRKPGFKSVKGHTFRRKDADE
jgi:hypothetical protein